MHLLLTRTGHDLKLKVIMAVQKCLHNVRSIKVTHTHTQAFTGEASEYGRPRWPLTFWRRIFFFQILAHSVFKMWVIQETNKVALWNKRHFEEKKWRLYCMFKIFSTDICWINIKWGIWRVILRPSYIWDARFLKVKGDIRAYISLARQGHLLARLHD